MNAPPGEVRVGCDVVSIARMEAVLARSGVGFLREIFFGLELLWAQDARDAATGLSIKEATLKAIGLGLVHGTSMRDIVVMKTEDTYRVALHGVPAALLNQWKLQPRVDAYTCSGHAHAVVALVPAPLEDAHALSAH